MASIYLCRRTNDEVGTFFPYYHQLTFAEGIAKEKLPPPAMMLSRATTAGSWRLGGASWDGDHHCAWCVQTQMF